MAHIVYQGNSGATISNLSGSEQTYIDGLPLPEETRAGFNEPWAEEIGDGIYRVPVSVADYFDRLANPILEGQFDPRDQSIT